MKKVGFTGKKSCEEWVLGLTNLKTNKGFSIPILNEELEELIEAFPFIKTRRGTYVDLSGDEEVIYDSQSIQYVLEEGL